MVNTLHLINAIIELNSFVSPKKPDSVSCKFAEKVWFRLRPSEPDIILTSFFRSKLISEWSVSLEVKEILVSVHNIKTSDRVSVYNRAIIKRDTFTTSRNSWDRDYKKANISYKAKKDPNLGGLTI